jgi:transcriptional regulator with XRE-family HTH domain
MKIAAVSSMRLWDFLSARGENVILRWVKEAKDQRKRPRKTAKPFFETALGGANMSAYRNTLREEFRDKDYRYAYAEDFLNTLIATQIKVLREQRGLTQQELADLIGTKQAGISRLENVNYSAWKTETLRKLARALGVRLRITFETFGTLLDEAEDFSQQSLERPEFDADHPFADKKAAILPEAAALDAEVVEKAPVHFRPRTSRRSKGHD